MDNIDLEVLNEKELTELLEMFEGMNDVLDNNKEDEENE